MKVNGKTIWQMVKEKLSMQIVVVITDSFSTIEDMEKVFSCRKDVFSRDLSSVINFKEKESCRLKTVKNIPELGRKIKNMAKDSIVGLMEIPIKDNIGMAIVMGLDS